MYFVEGLLPSSIADNSEVFAFFLYPRGDAVTGGCNAMSITSSTWPAARPPNRRGDPAATRSTSSSTWQATRATTHFWHLPASLRRHPGVWAIPPPPGWQPWTTGSPDEVTDPQTRPTPVFRTLYRLPTFFCCYRPLLPPLWRYQPYMRCANPGLTAGNITFGSCNNLETHRRGAGALG